MRHQILAALVAAFSFSAAGCDDRASSPPAPPPRVELRSMPKVDGPLAPPPNSLLVEAHEAPQAQVEKPQVGLAHEDVRTVDHLARAVSLREQGDLKGAVAEARRAVFDAPEDVAAVEQVEVLARASGDRNLRLLALEKIASVRTDDATPLIQKARVHLAMKDPMNAIRTGNDAAVRDTQNPEAYQVIGRAHLSLGQLAPAIAMFEKVVQLDPNHGYALNNLGFAYLRANRDSEAAEVLTRAAELLPRVAYVHNNLGVALERLGRTEDARRAYLDASFLSPKYVKAQVNVARIARLKVEDADEAFDADPMPESMTDIPLESLYPGE